MQRFHYSARRQLPISPGIPRYRQLATGFAGRLLVRRPTTDQVSLSLTLRSLYTRIVMRHVVVLLGLLVIQALTFAQLLKSPIDVSGTIVDPNGAPLGGVRIGHVEGTSVQTDSAGRFHLTTRAPSIVFRRDGFESVLLQLATNNDKIGVRMVPAERTSPLLACEARVSCLSTGRLCFPKVRGVEIGRIGGSIDAFERVFNVHRGRFQMIHGSGPSWGGPTPRDQDVWSSIEFKESVRDGCGLRVIDARGKTIDGKQWRSVGIPGESAFYFNVQLGQTAEFDNMLDSVCVRVR